MQESAAKRPRLDPDSGPSKTEEGQQRPPAQQPNFRPWSNTEDVTAAARAAAAAAQAAAETARRGHYYQST